MNQPAMVKTLIARSANVNSAARVWFPLLAPGGGLPDPDDLMMWKAYYAIEGATPLDWAVECGHSDVAALLSQHGGLRSEGRRHF